MMFFATFLVLSSFTTSKIAAENRLFISEASFPFYLVAQSLATTLFAPTGDIGTK